MKSVRWTGSALFLLFAAAALIAGGCSKAPQTGGKPAWQPAGVADVPQHGEWWCGEHGVPEEECAQCDTDLVAKFKAKGDWELVPDFDRWLERH